MDIDWLTIIGLVLVIEGMMPLLFPKVWQGYIRRLAEEPIGAIRQIGAVLFALGILFLWLR